MANGLAVEEGKVDGVRRVTSLDKVGHPYFGFETKAPVKYLSFIVGKFNRLTNGNGSSVPVEARISSDVRSARKGLIDEAKSVLKTFEGVVRPVSLREADHRPTPMAHGRRP